MKYRINWTRADGTRVNNQVYTADHVSYRLVQLEAEGCTNITIESFEEKDTTSRSTESNCKFYWDDDTKSIDNSIEYILDCIAELSVSEDGNDRIALEYFKREYFRLMEKRMESARDWLTAW